MKVRYKGETSVSLSNGKIYDVMSVEETLYRIIDDTGEDYLFMPERFEIVTENAENDKKV